MEVTKRIPYQNIHSQQAAESLSQLDVAMSLSMRVRARYQVNMYPDCVEVIAPHWAWHAIVGMNIKAGRKVAL